MNRNALVIPLALGAAGFYAVTGVLGIAHPQDEVFVKTVDYVHEGVFACALLLGAIVLALLARAGAGVGAWLGAAGNFALFPAAAATALTGEEALGPLFGIGLLAITAGYITLTVADVRGRLTPAGLGYVLLLGWIAAIPADALTGAGGLVLGAAWAGVAHVSGARPQRAVAVRDSVPA